MRSDSGNRPSIARRVSSADRERTAGAAGRGSRTKAWTLRVAPALLLIPLVWKLLAGAPGDVVALALALVLFYVGAYTVEDGLAREADYHARTITKAPRPPRKLLGAVLVGLAALVASLGASSADLALSLLFGATAGVACVLAYGTDPRQDKGLAPELARRAGLRTEQVIDAITEAEGKIGEIEQWAARLHGRELIERLRRITAQARAVLQQIEKDPSDLRRARRFLVTYLDGTRDVVRKYSEQQQDLAETPLAENFRHVLDTIERVFKEQEEVLKRNESLDLEVQIDVLRTQLEREGVV